MKSKRLNKINIVKNLLLIVLLIAFLFSFTIGRYNISYTDLFRAFLSKFFHNITVSDTIQRIVFNIRMPRIIASMLVGGCLAVAGASYQGVFQNPMASPDILGASQGAAFGAAIAILNHLPSNMITVFAFAFSIIAVTFVFFIGQKAPGNKILSFVLAGIMISSIFSSATSFVKLVADPSNELPAITYWMMGSLAGVTKYSIITAIIPMLAGLIPLILLRWRINILTLGDNEAISLGINPSLLRFVIILCSTLVTASAVSISGLIGWVGLVVPHMCRKLVGDNYKHVITTSFIFGAIFLNVVDDISRTLLATEIPIGILTSFVGAPFFIYLITKRKI